MDNSINFLDPVKQEVPNYGFLREAGIEYIQRLAGQSWTDYNTHDPGITILEQLCYALTDLNYRLGYSVPDILARNDGQAPYAGLYSPAEVLSSRPVTLRDLRKLVLDVPGVKNARIEQVSREYSPPIYYDEAHFSLELSRPHSSRRVAEPLPLQGLYRIYILVDKAAKPGRMSLPGFKRSVQRAVFKQFHAHRNVCEDLDQVIVLREEPIKIRAEIVLKGEVDLFQLLPRLWDKLDQYMSPRLSFKTLAESLAAGRTMEDIFDGPTLKRGFISDESLDAFAVRTDLRTSDMMALIMEEEEVDLIRHFTMSSSWKQDEQWQLNMEDAPHGARLAFALDLDKSDFSFYREGMRIPYPNSRIKPHGEIEPRLHLPAWPGRDALDALPAAGRYRHIGRYRSIQHHFPEIYGIGEAGLPRSAPPERKAYAKQLQAFLAFFDQILANYFAQWEGVKNLFSFQAMPATTYFSQDLYGPEGIPGFSGIRSPEKELKLPEREQYSDRQNRRLNHLLARFAEDLTDHALLAFAGQAHERQTEAKQKFLRDYPRLSNHRGGAFDCTEPLGKQDATQQLNVSGLQLRIYRKLGIPDEPGASLQSVPSEVPHPGGFHLVEHILLRPNPGDSYQRSPILLLPSTADPTRPPARDPYSLQLSFVLPAWVQANRTEAVQAMIVKIAREETPAHLSLHIHWLDREQMALFEEGYFEWLDHIRERYLS